MKPNFICIGAQKAGTTWLHRRLSSHVEFSMPPIKEMHYFDRAVHYPTPNMHSETSLVQRLRQPSYVRYSLKNISSSLRSRDYARAFWWVRYSFRSYSDQWYKSLFKYEEGVTGDITPSYSILNEEDIAKMHRVVPDAKIIFLLRNPIDRAWSSYRHLHKLDENNSISQYVKAIGDDVDFNSIDTIESFINSPFQELRSNYIRTIDLYLKYYKSSNIILGFYDSIIENPQKLLSALYRYIGVEDCADLIGYRNVDNKSISVPMPVEIRRILEAKYEPMLAELASRYGGYAKKWHLSLNGAKAEQAGGISKPSPVIHPL